MVLRNCRRRADEINSINHHHYHGVQDALDDLLPPGGTIEVDLEREVVDESGFLIYTLSS